MIDEQVGTCVPLEVEGTRQTACHRAKIRKDIRPIVPLEANVGHNTA